MTEMRGLAWLIAVGFFGVWWELWHIRKAIAPKDDDGYNPTPPPSEVDKYHTPLTPEERERLLAEIEKAKIEKREA
jgi:hypothetical protein